MAEEHKHGSMDISDHEATYEGFIRWSIRVGVAVIVVLLFLSLTAV